MKLPNRMAASLVYNPCYGSVVYGHRPTQVTTKRVAYRLLIVTAKPSLYCMKPCRSSHTFSTPVTENWRNTNS